MATKNEKKQDQIATTKQSLAKEPCDIAQVTVLLDKSDSMGSIWRSAKEATTQLIDDVSRISGVLFSIKTFNDKSQTISGFYDSKNSVGFGSPEGMTALFDSMYHALTESIQEEDVTSELKIHHVIIAITDGDSNADQIPIDQVKAFFERHDAKSTIILIDGSYGQKAGAPLGLNSIPFEASSIGIRKVMAEIGKCIAQIERNILERKSPNSGLCLPPAR